MSEVRLIVPNDVAEDLKKMTSDKHLYDSREAAIFFANFMAMLIMLKY